MFFKNLALIIFFFISTSCFSQSYVYKDGFGDKIRGGLSVSTLGVGGNVTTCISNKFDLRLQGSYFGYSYDINKAVKELQGNAVINTGLLGCFTDYYVFDFLHLSCGVAYNFTSFDLSGKVTDPVTIGDVILEPEEVGTLKVNITPGLNINPYLGFGLNLNRNRKFVIGFDLGLFYMGSPNVDLSADGMLEPTASEEQEAIMQKNISPLIYYPHLSVNLTYRFK